MLRGAGFAAWCPPQGTNTTAESFMAVQRFRRESFANQTLLSKTKTKLLVEYVPLSVGEPSVRLLRLELKWYGLGDGGTGVSSTGRHVSTIASRQLTNSSDDSPIMLYCRELNQLALFLFIKNWFTFVNGPAKRQRPPKPQLCRKCSCCCDGSSVASIFCIILWTAINTTWSLDTDRILLIFWSSNEWLCKILKELLLIIVNQSAFKYLHHRKHSRKNYGSFGQILIQYSSFGLVCGVLD